MSNKTNVPKFFVPSDTRTPIFIGVLVSVIFFGGFITWALFADLDQGIPANGTVIADTKRKPVQHLTGGVVTKIYVKDGMSVKKGQLLAKMLDINAKAQVSIHHNQVQVLNQQLKSFRPLVDEGYYPKNQYIELERQFNESREKLKIAQEEIERSEVRSPVDGLVMGITIYSENSILAPGGKLMEIVPTDDRMVIEAQIPTHLIDGVRIKQDAEIRFPALPQRRTPVLLGQLEAISPDRFVDTNNPNDTGYYKAKVIISQDMQEKLNGEQIQVGMPAQVIIKTGTRTFFDYLVKPLVDRAVISFKER